MFRIITHDGIFHADEVFAIAALVKWNNTEIFGVHSSITPSNFYNEDNKFGVSIIRSRIPEIIEIDRNTKNTYLIDVGNKYNVNNLEFDHHQSNDMFASNILIFKYLLSTGKIDLVLYNELLPFMMGISNWDTNYENLHNSWGEFNNSGYYTNISEVISRFNRNPSDEKLQNKQFKKAVEFAITILNNEEHFAMERIKAETTYGSREILDNNVAVFDEFCPIWKTKGEHNYAILPNPQGWSLNSADSNNYPLPDIEHKNLIFAHKAKFIAVFKTKEAAIEIAKKL